MKTQLETDQELIKVHIIWIFLLFLSQLVRHESILVNSIVGSCISLTGNILLIKIKFYKYNSLLI